MSRHPLAPLRHKQQLLSKIFLGIVLSGLLILGLIKIKELLYQPSITPEYYPFGLEAHQKVYLGENPHLNPDEIESLSEANQNAYKRALLLYKTKEPQSAWEILDPIVEKNEPNVNTLVLLSKCVIASEQVEEILLDTRRRIHQLLQNEPHPALSLQKALLDEILESPTIAKKTLYSIIQESPQYAQAYLELARIEKKLGDLKLARQSLQYAISLDPQTREKAYAMLASYFHQTGQLDSLTQLIDYTIEIYPHQADFNLYQGLIKEYQSELEEAARHYKKMIQVHPEDDRFAEALANIGRKEIPILKNSESKFQQAIESVESLYHQDPKNPGLAFAYYQMMKLSGDAIHLEKARDLHAISLAMWPNDPRWNPQSNEAPQETTLEVEEPGNDSLFNLAQTNLAMETQDRRNWELMGHYLLKWQSRPADLLEKYGKDRFQELKHSDNFSQYFEEHIDNGLKFQYNLNYPSNQLNDILINITDPEKLKSDLLGLILRKLVGVSGNPSPIESKICSGFRKFHAYHWTDKDNFELLIQFQGRNHNVRILRLDPANVPRPFDICQILPMILDKKERE